MKHSVYGHFKDGSCQCIGKDLFPDAAKKVADRHYKDTGYPAVIIIQEEDEDYENRRNRRNANNH